MGITQAGLLANSNYIICTSTTRPAGFNGALIFETDTGILRKWTGAVWLEIDGPAYAWTPTWTDLTPGNATVEAQYLLRGWTMHWNVTMTFGSTTTIDAANPKLIVPSGMVMDTDLRQPAAVVAYDSSPATYYSGTIYSGDSGGTSLTTRIVFNTTTVTATAPFTWATGDRLWMSGITIMTDVNAPSS
jgi:hypothetical protein